jgi:hypothetical protein
MEPKSRTAAQRYNDRKDKIFAQAKINLAKYAPYHMTQELPLLLEKIDKVLNLHWSGQIITEADWTELRQHSNRTQEVLEHLNEMEVVKEIKAGITQSTTPA